MRTYTTTQEQNFSISYASSAFSGYGHQKIKVEVILENGNKKEFSCATSNMPDFDDANNLEGQEKYEALFDLVDYKLNREISEWIYSLED